MTEPSDDVVVPRDPTEAMLEAGSAQYDECTEGGATTAACVAEHVWRAMLSAAPIPEQPRAERERVARIIRRKVRQRFYTSSLTGRITYGIGLEGVYAAADAILRPVVDREVVEVVRPLIEAARGLSFGAAWNDGTAAKTHGYRQKLLDALPAALALLPRERQEVGGGLSGFSQEPDEHPIWAEVGDCLACDGEPEPSAAPQDGAGERGPRDPSITLADWTERLQAICERFGCPPGLNRFRFIESKLAAAERLSRLPEAAQPAGVVDKYRRALELIAKGRLRTVPEHERHLYGDSVAVSLEPGEAEEIALAALSASTEQGRTGE